MQIKIDSIQVALIYQAAFTASFDQISEYITSKYKIAKVNKIPLPDDFPADDIPRLEISNPEKNILLRFSKSRADIFFNSSSIDTGYQNEFVQVVSNINVVVGRIGYVQKTIYSEIKLSFAREKIPSLSLIVNDDNVLEASQKINKKTNLKYLNEEIECNNIASLTLGRVEGDNSLALLLERDVNTLQTRNLGLSNTTDIGAVITALQTEASGTLFVMTEND